MSKTKSWFLFPTALLLAFAVFVRADLSASPTEGDASVTPSLATFGAASECVASSFGPGAAAVSSGAAFDCSDATLGLVEQMLDEECGEEGGTAMVQCEGGKVEMVAMCGDVDIVTTGGSGG